MKPIPTRQVCARLALLQAELVEQAYALERQGRVDAADVAIATAGRVGELWAELGEMKGAGSEAD